jgi:hypothetical protein
MPHTLHEELAHTAEREAVSLNQLIVRILSRATVDRGQQGTASSRTADATSVDDPAPAGRSRTLTVALALNLVVVGLAGLVAIGLLVAAWRNGF